MKANKSSIAILAVAGLALAGCSSKEIQGVCDNDADCGTGFKCIEHQCLCQTDQACADDEFCNPQGFCQKVVGCRVDSDCGEYMRCQLDEHGRGTCLCTGDQACPDGQFCNSSGSCQDVPGCLLDSDCGDPNLYFCRINPETDVGQCYCKADEACEKGEFCNPKGFCQPKASCTTNDDCPAGKLCDTSSGECLCDPDSQTGCRSDEVCNSSGYCQPRPGCYDNSDCEDTPGTFCDLTTQTCIPEGTCTSDRQCPLGQVCRNRTCVPGCNQSYDCPLDQCCVGNQCQPCDCQNDEFCAFAEYCQNGGCQSAYSASTPFCKPCDSQSLDYNQCGSPTNRCLIYPYTNDAFAAQSSEYCAVDCEANERCPAGFVCSQLVVIKQSDQCRTDADCPSGVPCWKSPEEDTGYCPCHPSMNPCPIDTCDTLGIAGPRYTCVNTKKPCQTSADCLIQCVADPDSTQGFGGCVVAKNCGLAEGVHCPDPNNWP